MGFYGNITNTARTQFQFDKIYPNRYEMERSTHTDGIYAGRYVLIEYDTSGLDTYTEVQKGADGYLYTNPKGVTDKKTLLTVTNTIPGELVYETLTQDDKVFHRFYKITGDAIDISSQAAAWEILVSNDGGSAYVANYNIDESVYGPSRGFDSTAWQKVYGKDTGEKYIMIAELNTVVPKFDVVADAPTMNPVVPHFDKQSTDVYYKLHWQTPWGFRIGEASDESLSDEETVWTHTTYDPNQGINITTESEPLPAAIYYNKKAFDPRQTIYKRVLGEDYIKIVPVESGEAIYNDHEMPGNTKVEKDIQEMSINLPTIGNMVSDGWDIIYGPNRDDARTDENSSLKGRLDSFSALEHNHIPVKRADDGTIVGSMINSAQSYDSWTDKPQDILDDISIPGFTRDDAWIETTIATEDLAGGFDVINQTEIDQSNNCGISIHHTFHKTDDSSTTIDKNTGVANVSDTHYKEAHIPYVLQGETKLSALNADTGKTDTIKLYLPYVDAKGHVVGKNIETITLPYGYKTFTTPGLNSNANSDLYTTITENENGAHTSAATASVTTTIADNTQDVMSIEMANKWLQAQITNDKLILGHEIHAIPNVRKTDSNLNPEVGAATENNINIPDWSYDKAGHITGKHDHYYTLPFGFKTMKVANSTSVATAANSIAENGQSADTTQDTLTFTASNRWIVLDNMTEDTIKIGHAKAGGNNPSNVGENTAANPLFGESFKTPYLKYDETGHVINHGLRTVTLPIGSLEDTDTTVTTANVLTAIDFTPSTGAITVKHDNVGDLLLTGLTPVKESDVAWVQSTDDIKGAFVKVDTRLDNEITRATNAESDLNKRIDDLDYTDTPGTGKVVYSVSQTNGAISAEHKNVGDLLMDGYVKPTTLANQSLSATESLSTSLGKLEYRLETEVKAREDAIKALDVSDTAVENSYVTEVSETDGKISVKRTALPTLQTGTSNGTIKLSNGTDVSVYGLRSAAYTDTTAYATAEQGIKADNALPATQTFAYGSEQKTIAELFALVHTLSGEVTQLRTELTALQEKVNTEHPVVVEPETPAEPTE